MKKRSFLSPLAVSVAALLAASPSAASTDLSPPSAEISEAAIESKVTEVIGEPFVLERSQETAIQTAYHRSHYSHQSHYSHYSSY